MEPGFLSRHPLNQLLDPIKDWLIREPGGQKTMLDLPVDFDARVTPRPLGEDAAGIGRSLRGTLVLQCPRLKDIALLCPVSNQPNDTASFLMKAETSF
jgi:hypothetical protein